MLDRGAGVGGGRGQGEAMTIRGAGGQAVNRCTSFSKKANRPHRATESLRWASRIP